jgi:hypothetical protein
MIAGAVHIEGDWDSPRESTVGPWAMRIRSWAEREVFAPFLNCSLSDIPEYKTRGNDDWYVVARFSSAGTCWTYRITNCGIQMHGDVPAERTSVCRIARGMPAGSTDVNRWFWPRNSRRTANRSRSYRFAGSRGPDILSMSRFVVQTKESNIQNTEQDQWAAMGRTENFHAISPHRDSGGPNQSG